MIEWLEDFFRSIGGFITLMGVLVTVHEYGHFIVARKLGFAVTKFSIGFGKNLWSRKGKDGVEYAIGLIPLGGYVAFVDDVEEGYDKSLLNGMRFNEAAIWQKTCVVAAGPLANFLLAIVLLWGLFMYGVPAIKPYIDVTEQNSPFAKAGLKNGDLILSINGDKTDSQMMMVNKLIEHLGDGQAEIVYQRNNSIRNTVLDIGGALQLDAKTDFYKELGFTFHFPPVKPIIGQIVKGSNVDESGLLVGDLIVAIDGNRINEWQNLLDTVAQLKDGQTIKIEVDRKGVLQTFSVALKADEVGKVMLGVGLDAASVNMEAYEKMVTKERLGVIDAGSAAFGRTADESQRIFKFIGRMFKGDIHINTMAGPVSIANIAGQVLASGLVYFIQLTAIFSINIGLLNLLPIPVLDGGRLVGFGIEKVMGKHQFPDSIKIKVLQLGAILMFTFMAIVVGYDLIRWF